MQGCNANFRYLNRDGVWPDFERRGLELRPDGSLGPYRLPLFSGDPDATVSTAFESPAGIAVDRDGSVFYSDPPNHRVIRIDGCFGQSAATPCLRPGDDTAYGLDTPRGLLIPPDRRALYVADSGNHRVQIFDLDNLALRGALGVAAISADPQPSSRRGRFDTPTALAADPRGNVYVVDSGNRRVEKFDPFGEIDAAFWDRIQAAGALEEAVDIAVGGPAEAVRVYVLDRSKKSVLAFDDQGNPEPLEIPIEIASPLGIAVVGDSLYVGDNSRRRLLCFRLQPHRAVLAGEAVGFDGTVTAAAPDGRGSLLVHAGGSHAPVALQLDAGFGSNGLAWGGPFSLDCPELRWRHVHASADVPERGGHLQFFWRTADDDTPPLVQPEGDDPFPASQWREVVPDLTDFFVGADSTRRFWIGMRFTSDGEAAASLSQLRAELDQDSYLRDLPAVYQQEAPCGDFLDRFLALFESFFQETERDIRAVPALFDPDAAPERALDWLASWLALELDDSWPEEVRRDAIEKAFERYGRAGTPSALRETIEREAGVRAVIDEPIVHAGWWALPGKRACGGSGQEPEWTQAGDSVLGWTTRLASSEAQGAVLGTSATLDGSHLISTDEYAAPLFEELAHQFRVLVYPADVYCADKLELVRAIIDREKPAHTAYVLCVAQPRFRIGFQARLGIDTIVAARPSASRLGETGAAGGALALGGTPHGRLGESSRVGVSTRL